MRHFLAIFLLIFSTLPSVQTAALFCNGNNLFTNQFPGDTTNPGTHTKQTTPAAQWDAYWKEFTAAIHAKDTAKIALLTSADFYDGGGATVQEWLQSDVYASDKTFTTFTSLLKKGTRPFKSYGKTPYRATGNNKSGDYFFEYSKGRWVFGGMVGD